MRSKRGDLRNWTQAPFTKIKSVLRNGLLLSVVVAPVVLSGCTGMVTSNGTGSPAPVAPTITTQPTDQTVTAGQTATFTVVATGTSPLSYQWVKNGTNVTAATSASYTTPATATSDGGAKFDVVVSNSAGTVTSATATLTVNAIAVAPTITTQPANQTVTAGQTATFTVAATGTAPLSYQWNRNGAPIAGANSSSYTTPAATSSDNGAQFTVVVSNTVGSVTSNVAMLTVNLPQPQISVVPSSVSFGNVVMGTTNTQTVNLTNTGGSNVTISSLTVTGTEFSTSGLTPPVSLAAGQTTSFNVIFAPTSPNTVSGSVAVASNATNSPATIMLSGSAHWNALSWTASTSVVVGYNVYRGDQSGGPYTKINSTPAAATTYTDDVVQSGHTYFYVVTAVDANNDESVYSNEVSAAVP